MWLTENKNKEMFAYFKYMDDGENGSGIRLFICSEAKPEGQPVQAELEAAP